MKSFFLSLLFAGITLSAAAQRTFNQGSIVFGPSVDVGNFDYKLHLNAVGSSSDKAAKSAIFGGFFEFGLFDRLGIGLDARYNRYNINKDSSNAADDKAHSVDASLMANLHILRLRPVDLLAGVNLGYSQLHYDFEDDHVKTINGNSFIYNVHLQLRIYFTKHFGIFANAAYTWYNFKDMVYQNTSTKIDDVMDIKGGTGNLGAGVAFKF